MTDKTPTGHGSHAHDTRHPAAHKPAHPAGHPAHGGADSHSASHRSAPRTAPKKGRSTREHVRAHQHLRAVKPAPSRRLRLTLIVVSLLLLLAAAFLIWRSHRQVSGQARELNSDITRGPLVETTRVTLTPPGTAVVLEGESRPYVESTLYAKVSGYLQKIFVDAGSVVKTGDLLAQISSPETDQAYASAAADYRNKERIARRYRTLLRQKLVSAQEAEQAFTAADTALATLRARAQQRDYEQVRAPFDGTVTARLVDPGALIPDASNNKADQLAIVAVAQTERLKVDAYLDQKYAPYVHAGLPVSLFLPERTDDKIPGIVARVAGALDRHARMLPLEIDIDNRAQKIVAGSFVMVELRVPSPSYLSVPVEAIVTQNGKPAVAEVGADKKLHFQPISVIENDGTNVAYTDGPPAGTRLALNLGDSIKEGQLVRVQESGGQGGQGTVGPGPGPMGSGSNQGNASAAGQGTKKKDDKDDDRGQGDPKKQEKKLEKDSKKPDRGPGDT